MTSALDALPLLDLPTLAAWRAWLESNHAAAPGARLLLVKRSSGLAGLRYDDAVEEALCFGWIDSKTNAYDADHTVQVFTPRKPGGTWAKSNKERVARLIEQGRMTPVGLAVIQQAQADGSWNRLEEIQDPTIPDDLAAALAQNEEAARNFAAFSPSSRTMFLAWIRTAKRPETRAKRIAETVRLAAQNIKGPQPATKPATDSTN